MISVKLFLSKGEIINLGGTRLDDYLTSLERHELGEKVSLCSFVAKNGKKTYVFVSASSLKKEFNEEGYIDIDYRIANLNASQSMAIEKTSFSLEYYEGKEWVFSTCAGVSKTYTKEQAEDILGDVVEITIKGVRCWASYFSVFFAENMFEFEKGTIVKARALLAK